MTATVVGGGIGGIAAALALRRAGLTVTVLEAKQELVEAGQGDLAHGHVDRPAVGPIEHDPLFVGRPVLTSRCDHLEQRLPLIHLLVDRGEQPPDPPGEGGGDRHLHLHGLDHRQWIAFRDFVAGADPQRDDNGGCRGANDPNVLPGDPVFRPLDDDHQVGTLRSGGNPVVAAQAGQPPLATGLAFGPEVDPGAVHLDPEPVPFQLANDQAVGLSATAQLDRVSDPAVDLRPAPRRRGQEGGPDPVLLFSVRLERRLEEGNGRGLAHGFRGANPKAASREGSTCPGSSVVR